jgi:hypothetical protein
MAGFWDSFQGILGPHGFKGWQGKDFFDDERWKFKATPEWENPNVMGAALGRPAGTYNYQPRGGIPSKPGASIASTRPRTIRRPQSPQPRRLDPRAAMMKNLQRDAMGVTTAIPDWNTPSIPSREVPPSEARRNLMSGIGRVAEETGRFWNPKLENLARTTGDYWGPKADRVMDETAQFWNPMIKRDLGRLEETWDRADLVGDTKRYWTPVVKDLAPKQVWNEAQQLFQPKWEDLLKYLRRND